jgi:hypothetical protein
MTGKHIAAVLAAALASFRLGGQEADGGPAREDFSGSVTITGTEGRLLSLEIPEDVYRGLERGDRGDIRIFDAGNLPVPFVIRPLQGSAFTPPALDVPFFVWEQKDDSLPKAGTDIVIESGTVVRIINKSGGGNTQKNTPVYLLDFSGFDYTPVSLILDIENESYYHSAVRLYSGGADLVRWEESSRRQIVAWYGEARSGGEADSGVNRNSLELPDTGMRYLLLKFEHPDLVLRSIAALFGEVEIPPPSRESAAGGAFAGGGRRIIEYDTKGFYPLVSLAFILPGADSIEADLKSRLNDSEEWRTLRRITLFRFSGADGDLFNEPVEVSFSYPHWRLESHSFPFAAVPECRFQWMPEELVFPARGKGPWTLAYGNADCGPLQSAAIGELLGRKADGPGIEKAVIGEPVYIRQKGKGVFPFRIGQFLLWAILIIAVIVLTSLAWYIAKIMKKEDRS